jgi:hypothetical protein
MNYIPRFVGVSLIFFLLGACTDPKVVASSDEMPVRIRLGISGPWGFLDHNLEVIIPPKFLYATEFVGGIAVVKEHDQEAYHIINQVGERIAQIDADFVDQPSDGMIEYVKNKEKGYCDYKGEKVLKGYTETWAFKEGKAFVSIGNDRFYIDKSGRRLFPDLKISIGGEFHEGLAVVRVAKGYGSYDYGMIDDRGRYVIAPKYSFLGNFSEDLAVVGIGETRGYINKKGKIVIPPIYYFASPFNNGIAFVSDQKKNDSNYFKIISPLGDVIRELNEEYDSVFHHGSKYSLIKKISEDGQEFKIGFLDEKGNLVIEPAFYSDEWYFSSGYWIVFLKEAGIYRTVIVDPSKGEIYYLDNILKNNAP